MTARSFFLLVSLAALCLCGGCDIEFPEQEVYLRHDAEADTLDVLLVYLGVTTPGDGVEALDKGQAVAERVLAGRREFMFLDWPFNFDLDQERPEDEPLEPGVEAVLEQVRLERVGAFLDETGRLCGFQHFRLNAVSTILAEANRALDRSALQALETGELDSEDLPWFDDAEERTWRAFLAAETPWVSLEAGRLVVRLPVSAAGAARFMVHLAQAVRAESGQDLGAIEMLLANVSGLQVSEGLATLHLGRLQGAGSALSLDRAVEYTPALLERLADRGLDLSRGPSLAEVRGLLGN